MEGIHINIKHDLGSGGDPTFSEKRVALTTAFRSQSLQHRLGAAPPYCRACPYWCSVSTRMLAPPLSAGGAFHGAGSGGVEPVSPKSTGLARAGGFQRHSPKRLAALWMWIAQARVPARHRRRQSSLRLCHNGCWSALLPMPCRQPGAGQGGGCEARAWHRRQARTLRRPTCCQGSSCACSDSCHA